MENFKDKVVVVTGGAQGIGRCIADEFLKAGAHICVIDKQDGEHFVGDISEKAVLEQFAKEVIGKYGHVDYLINISSSRDRMSQRDVSAIQWILPIWSCSSVPTRQASSLERTSALIVV